MQKVYGLENDKYYSWPLGGCKDRASHLQSRHTGGDFKKMRLKAKFRATNGSFADVGRRLFALHTAVVGIGNAVVQLVFAFRAPDGGRSFPGIVALDNINADRATAGRSGGHRTLGLAAGQRARDRDENEGSKIHELLWRRNCRKTWAAGRTKLRRGDALSIVNIAFQLFDDEFLLGKHFLHHITD